VNQIYLDTARLMIQIAPLVSGVVATSVTAAEGTTTRARTRGFVCRVFRAGAFTTALPLRSLRFGARREHFRQGIICDTSGLFDHQARRSRE